MNRLYADVEQWPVPTTRAHDALHTLCHSPLALVHAIVTQNVDGLHRAAEGGRCQLIEMHGSLHRTRCVRCKALHPFAATLFEGSERPLVREVPHCTPETCQAPQRGKSGALLPDVVLFGDCVEQDMLQAAVASMLASRLVIVVGTALDASPTADLPLVAMRAAQAAGRSLDVVEVKRSGRSHATRALRAMAAECDNTRVLALRGEADDVLCDLRDAVLAARES